MTPEPLSIRHAWSQIPSPGSVDSEFESFTADRMERILATVVAIGSAALGLQALLAAMGAPAPVTPGRALLLLTVYLPLVAMLIACVIGRGVRVASAVFSVAYVVALAVWPLVVQPREGAPDSQPWIFFLVNVAVVAALLAFGPRLQLLWALGVPLLYGYVRLVQGEFSREFWTATAFDVSFTLILGVVLVCLAWMFRSVAAGVDDARGRAVASYAGAAAVAAAEEERVAMAALMHDSVLAALIAAERADTERSRDLAVGMAREALTRLANTEGAVAQEGSDEPVSSAQIVVELRRVLSELGADAVVEQRGGETLIPGRPARAIALAARQAIGNAITHAHGRGLHVLAEALPDAVIVTVLDAGAGFDVADIAADRLGIRASIVARMAAVAGQATIDSGPEGTCVRLRWEAS